MYVARNRDGSLRLYDDKPIRGINIWYVMDKDGGYNGGYPVKSNLFPEVTWEDDEPAELIIKN